MHVYIRRRHTVPYRRRFSLIKPNYKLYLTAVKWIYVRLRPCLFNTVIISLNARYRLIFKYFEKRNSEKSQILQFSVFSHQIENISVVRHIQSFKRPTYLKFFCCMCFTFSDRKLLTRDQFSLRNVWADQFDLIPTYRSFRMLHW